MRKECPIRGIAFDLDCTLTDSDANLITVLDRVLLEQDLPPTDLACIAI